MNRRTRRIVVALVVGGVLALTGCASSGIPEPTAAGVSPDSSPAATSGPSASATASAPSCQSILPDSTVTDFESLGWTARPATMTIGSTEIPGGVMCTWGNYSVPSDHVQEYGWAPVDAAIADRLIAELVALGWDRVDSDAGVHLTQPSVGGVSSEFGMSYLFTDGQVRAADTEQGLLLVEDPRD